MKYGAALIEKLDDVYKETSIALLSTEVGDLAKQKVLIDLLQELHLSYHKALELYALELKES